MEVLTTIPLPKVDEFNREYWEGCNRHELLIQRCSSCGQLRFPPRPMCPGCMSFETEWAKMSGKAKVISWCVAYPPVLPAFEKMAPYAVVLVELDEGPHMVSNLVNVGIDDILIGMPLEVVFDRVAEDISLPKFKSAK